MSVATHGYTRKSENMPLGYSGFIPSISKMIQSHDLFLEKRWRFTIFLAHEFRWFLKVNCHGKFIILGTKMSQNSLNIVVGRNARKNLAYCQGTIKSSEKNPPASCFLSGTFSLIFVDCLMPWINHDHAACNQKWHVEMWCFCVHVLPGQRHKSYL